MKLQWLKVHLTADLFIWRTKSTFFLNSSSEKIFWIGWILDFLCAFEVGTVLLHYRVLGSLGRGLVMTSRQGPRDTLVRFISLRFTPHSPFQNVFVFFFTVIRRVQGARGVQRFWGDRGGFRRFGWLRNELHLRNRNGRLSTRSFSKRKPIR